MVKSIPELFDQQIGKYTGNVLVRHKINGNWEDILWEDVGKDIAAFTNSLIEIGINPKDKVALLSDNRYEWMISDIAIQSTGAADVPIYASSTPAQIEYILNDSEAIAVVLSTKEQLDKVLEIKDKIPNVKNIIAMDATSDGVLSFNDLLEKGKSGKFNDEIKKRKENIQLEDLATIIYTSGTTGNPKGVMLTQSNFVKDVEAAYAVMKTEMSDEISLSFLPWTHSFGRTADLYLGLYHGRGIMVIAESIQKVAENMKEIRPTMFASVPRIYEKVYSKIISQVEVGPPLKKKIFYWSLKQGREAAQYKLNNKSVPFLLNLKLSLADKLVFGKIRDALGGRFKFGASGGGPLSKELGEIFYAMGIKIVEGYGLTETTPIVTINPPDAIRFGTVGKPVPTAEVKIADDGEILLRGPMIMKGYYNNPEATKEAIDKDGWFYSGDIGHIDEDGYIHITDRKKDLIVTAGGKNIAPQPIENDLKMNMYIEQAVMIGDAKPYCVALLVPDYERLEEYAQNNNIQYSSNKELLQNSDVKKLFQDAIDELNKELPRYETIKYFKLMENAFEVESGELTPSLKVKRFFVQKKYKDIIDKMYK